MMFIIEETVKVVAQKHKAVVVSQWSTYLKIFSQHFYRINIRTHQIDGSIPVKMRTQIVEDFNNNPKGPPVPFIQVLIILAFCNY
jgi:transcription termination factor 2